MKIFRWSVSDQASIDYSNAHRETHELTGVLLGDILLGLGIGLALHSDDGDDEADALLALLDAAIKLFPLPEPGNAVASGLCRTISRMLPKL